MIKPYFIRSTIFNLCFYVLTGVSCIVLLPTLFLPRSAFLAIVYGFISVTALLEKYILGLTYEIRGKEHLPKEGSYIVAAKHQSAYETLKLHILFNDPAIVLKKELLKIPLWGRYLAKSDVIAIDRSTPKMALKSMNNGAKHVAAQNRPIVIFPQGTRVPPDVSAQEIPYKIGIMRMQKATKLPIIPMALNTGIFYPKKGWCKKPGKVIFEFLPPVMPSADPSGSLKQIEMAVEEKTSRLMTEGRENISKKFSLGKIFAIALIILCSAYTINWFVAAHLTKNAVIDFLNDIKQSPSIIDFQITNLKISGFPNKLQLSLPSQEIKTRNGNISIASINAQSWPALGMPIDIQTGRVDISMPHWKQALSFDNLDALITYKGGTLNITHAILTSDNTQGSVSGDIFFNEKQYPKLDLNLDIKNYAPLLQKLIANKIVKEKPAMFASMALEAMQQDGVVSTTVRSIDNKIYLGPLKVLELPKIRH